MGRVTPGLLLLAVVSRPEPDAGRVVVPWTPGPGIRAEIELRFRKGVRVRGSRLPPSLLPKAAADEWAEFEDLTPTGKRKVLEALFPRDRWDAQGVRHVVTYPELESLWLLAQLFTGHGQNYDRLRELNRQKSDKLVQGDEWRVPQALLSRDLGGPGAPPDYRQPEDGLEEEEKLRVYRQMLAYGKDRQGRFALYRLRKGEALYSSVVMRYSDRVDPKGVNELAQIIAERSGIEDVTAIPPGTAIKIPVQYLSNPFKEEGSEGLREDRTVREEVGRIVRIDAGEKLEGVRIILDAGHGGRDPGAMANGVWESDFVYDIVMRVRKRLEESTDARISVTTRLDEVGFASRNLIEKPSRTARILTTPPFVNDEEMNPAMGVHLRWILSNHWVRQFVEEKGSEKRTLFLSFHADSLHPTARGSMVYVADSMNVPLAYTHRRIAGMTFREQARGARFETTRQERIRSEARSRLFAESLLRNLRSRRLEVHANRPIRSVIHRGGRDFVPAVIRYNQASTKALVEVCNLNNPEDAERLKTHEYRERYAEAVVAAVKAYFRK